MIVIVVYKIPKIENFSTNVRYPEKPDIPGIWTDIPGIFHHKATLIGRLFFRFCGTFASN